MAITLPWAVTALPPASPWIRSILTLPPVALYWSTRGL